MSDKVVRKISKTPICGIYQITNKVNNKIYIGQSIDIERRWNQHKYGKGSVVLMNAIKKYGLDNFEFKILEETPQGTHPIRITPAAISGGKSMIKVKVNASKGMIVNCKNSPIKTPFGILSTPIKSFKPMAVPIPNIISCIKGTIKTSVLNPPTSIMY